MNPPTNGGFQTAGSTLASLVKAIPFGTLTIISIVNLFLFINFLSSWGLTDGLCLSSTSTVHGVFTHIFPLMANQFVHNGIVHHIIAILFFPFAAANIESEIGTFPFLFLFLVGGVITSIAYVCIVWFLSWFVPSWGTFCVNGLDTSFFMFLYIDSLSDHGLIEITRRFGLQIPKEFYPVPYIIGFAIFVPSTSIIMHICACLTAFLYVAGFLDQILLTTRAVNSLETSGMFHWVCQQPTFVARPGSVQLSPDLPMPGGFDPLLDVRRPTSDRTRPSFLSQITNSLQQINTKSYVPIQETQADPLLWDEDTERIDIDSNHSPNSNQRVDN
ncbi:hypothetical protein BC833DRAFT_571799 [Globomyces pollinis-pini]|nr:hypothetical protein BC833DRAFT_571799 [Globomyces pollinis-pini]